jgi:hypothetical protein
MNLARCKSSCATWRSVPCRTESMRHPCDHEGPLGRVSPRGLTCERFPVRLSCGVRGQQPHLGLRGRLAQLVRAPRLHRGGRGFESLIAHFAFRQLPADFGKLPFSSEITGFPAAGTSDNFLSFPAISVCCFAGLCAALSVGSSHPRRKCSSATRWLLPIHLHTTCPGNTSSSSVCRLDRRFWNSFGHGLSPARSIIFNIRVRKLVLVSR